MTKVSIITTCYNHKEFIGEAIESVVAQNFLDRELLVGDDSPNNDSWEIIEGWVKKYPEKIHAWHHKENKGITRNMDFLIEKSNGEYIVVLEGDDVLHKDYLKKKLEIFDRFPEVMLVYNDLDIINSKGGISSHNYLANKVKVEKFYKCETFNIEDIFNSFKIPYHSWSTLMFKKELLNKIPIAIKGLSPYNMITDYNFFMRTGNLYKIYGIEECLTKYRIHDNNLSRENGTFQLIVDLCALFNQWEKEGLIKNKDRKKIRTRYLLILGCDSIVNSIKTSLKETLKNFFQLTVFRLFLRLFK